RHLVRAVQPAQRGPDARGEWTRAPHQAARARAGALHPPRRAEDSARVAPLPSRPRRRGRDLNGLVGLALDREPELLPLAPGTRIELSVPAREVEPVQDDRR